MPELAAPIFYLLGALTGEQPVEELVWDRKGQLDLGIPELSLSPDLSPVLSETQQQLLAKALETTVLSKQLELVRRHGIGDAVGPWVHPGRFSQPASLGLRLQFSHLQPLTLLCR